MKPDTHAISAAEINDQQTFTKIWIGRILSGFAVLFMLFDSVTKILQNPFVMQASAKFGYPAYYVPLIGIVLLCLTILYIIPKTSIFAAILLTGYLGGAVEANLHAFSPFFSNTLFPVYFAAIIWGGIYLRDDLIKQFIPFRKRKSQWQN